MKILHTSDWHLGQMFYDYDRTAEQRDMLQQLTQIVRQEQPDAMVVSGDVFHTGSPSATAVEMYNQAVLAMHDACPTMTIVVTAGNHDSAARLVVNNALWSHFHVSIVGHVARCKDENRGPDYAAQVVAVNDAKGEPLGYIAAVPHCYESNYPTADPSLQHEQRVQAYYQGLGRYVQELNTRQLPVVLMAHLAVGGADFAGHDLVGGMECQDVEVLTHHFDYVALGHIHTPQNVRPYVRYCGTPIPVNFGEKFEHSVSVVQVTRGEQPVIEPRTIRNLIPLRDFPSSTPVPFSEVLDALRQLPADDLCYLRLMVLVDESLTPLAQAQVGEAVRDKQCRFCLIKTVLPPSAQTDASHHAHLRMDAVHLKEKSPLDIATLFFEMKGLELSQSMQNMILEATREAEQSNHDHHEA